MAIKKELNALTGEQAQQLENVVYKLRAGNSLGYQPGTKQFENVDISKNALGRQGINDYTVTPEEIANLKFAMEKELVPRYDDVFSYLSSQKLTTPTLANPETGRTFDSVTGNIYDSSGALILGISGGAERQITPEQKMSAQFVPPTTTAQKYGDVLTLASGQKISASDPNYDVYAKQLGISNQLVGSPMSSDLRSTVDNQAVQFANKTANKDYINGVFKAYHGRDANAQELSKFGQMTVGEAYNQIKGGSPLFRGAQDILSKVDFSTPTAADLDFEKPMPSTVLGQSTNEYEVAKNEFNQFADSYLSGLDKQINNLLQKQEAYTTSLREEKEAQRSLLEKGLQDVAGTDFASQYKKELEAQNFKVNQEKLTSVMEEIVKVKESLNLGTIQEGNRVAPMSAVTRRQQVIEQQGLARIGALTSIAEIYQGNMNTAMTIAEKTAGLLQAQVSNQMGAYEKLINLAQEDIISLKSDEKEFLNAQIDLLKQTQEKIEKNKDEVLKLIVENPEAAQKGGVSFTDSKEEAVAKMLPYISTTKENDISWTKIGTDSNGNDIYGFVDKTTKRVTPFSGSVGSAGSIATPAVGTAGGQCGTFARSQYSEIADGQPMGDTLQSKTDWVKKYGTIGVAGLEVGDLVITDGSDVSVSGNALPAGHALIVKSIDANGNKTAYESNARGDEMVTDNRQIPLTSNAIVGYVKGTLKEELKTSSSTEVTAWAKQINEGKATIANVPDALKNKVVEELSKISSSQDSKQETAAKAKVKLINELLKSKGLNSAVGPTVLTRHSLADWFTGEKQNFVAGVQQLISTETLDTLLELKKGGGTLGALSDQERIMLQNSASKIGNWAVTDKNGKVKGYAADQDDFKAELERIKELAEKALSKAKVKTTDPLGLGINSDPLGLNN